MEGFDALLFGDGPLLLTLLLEPPEPAITAASPVDRVRVTEAEAMKP